ncbi:MAG: diguanylate cyclase [Acidobacteria bacterium]|nr:diguanylate cyclase [Acidobacteriota bacterium]
MACIAHHDNRVLVAEDDPIFRLVLRTQLEKWGYNVATVEDGQQAWEMLQSDGACTLLLLDWMMPGIDGVELCRRIRERQHNRYHYILLVTSKDHISDVVSALEAGADDYVKKPFDMAELRARLLVGRRILALQEELITTREGLRFQATHDCLTGLWNGAAIGDILQREIARADRAHSALGVLMLDIDRFKTINDTFGHLTGDVVLREVARRIANGIRSYDSVGRYGGEEFLVVLPGCGADEIRLSAERVRLSVSNRPIVTGGTVIPATVSVGGACAGPNSSARELVRNADLAMYAAKRAGRDRSEVFVAGQADASQETLRVPCSRAESEER